MFKTLKNWFMRSYHRPEIPFSSPDASEFLVTQRSRSGQMISTETALQYSPVWQAVDLITSDISRIPFLTYERSGDGKQRARSHPAYKLLRRYTGEMNANMWLVRMVGHALLYGNGYTRLRFSGQRLVGFEWLHADRVTQLKSGGRISYVVKPDPDDRFDRGGEIRYGKNRIFHLEGLAIKQLGGLSIVQYARDTLGRGRAAEGFGDDYYANGGQSVIFSHPGQLSQEAQKRWLRQFQDRHSGQGNRFKYGIIEEGMKAETIGVSAEDAQLIDSLQFSVKDVARFFNIPAHKLGDDSKTSFNSVEQENMSYFNSSLGKWTSRLEFEANQKLFTEQERDADTHFAEFKVDALFKANVIDRMNAAAIAVSNGIKSRNEVRAEENLNPYDGGDEYLRPLNLASDDESEQEDSPRSNNVPSTILIRDVVLDAYERITRKICMQATRVAGKPERYSAWLNQVDDNYHIAAMDALCPSLRLCGLTDDQITRSVSDYLKTVSAQLLAASAGDIDDITAARHIIMQQCLTSADALFAEETCV